ALKALTPRGICRSTDATGITPPNRPWQWEPEAAEIAELAVASDDAAGDHRRIEPREATDPAETATQSLRVTHSRPFFPAHFSPRIVTAFTFATRFPPKKAADEHAGLIAPSSRITPSSRRWAAGSLLSYYLSEGRMRLRIFSRTSGLFSATFRMVEYSSNERP